MKDWSSISAQKYKTLLAIRSVIFYQLFDTVAKESDYSKTVWYRISSNRKKRYCQAKFFILGYNDESNIPSSSVKIIDDTATKLQDIFNNLSGYGKYGESKVLLLENTFRDTISYFATALKLRKHFYLSSP